MSCEWKRVSASLSRNRRTSGRDRWWSLVQRNCIETTRVIKYSRIYARPLFGRGEGERADERGGNTSRRLVCGPLRTGGCHTIRRLEPSTCIVRLDTNDYNSRQLKHSSCAVYIFNVRLVNIGWWLKKIFPFFLSFLFTRSESEESRVHTSQPIRVGRSLRIHISKLSRFLHPDDVWNLC